MQFQAWNSMKLCLSTPFLTPMLLHRRGGSKLHGASVIINCFDIHEVTFPRYSVLGCICIVSCEQMHDWISMKPWVFSLFLIPTLSPSSELSTCRYSPQAPYELLWEYSNTQVEEHWNWGCFYEKVLWMEFSETFPVVSPPHTDVAPQWGWFNHAWCFCYDRLFRFSWMYIS